MKSNSTSVTSNFLWRFAERCGAQGVTLVVSIVLARLLDPDMYGIVAIVTVFTSILQVFIDGGMGNALIQKKDSDDLDFSTVFYFNCIMCLVLYFLMFLISPVISSFYKMPELTLLIRVLSLTVIISGVKNIQQAYVSKNMLFKRFFYATLGGTLVAAFVGIAMAYAGFGVWALVVQQLTNAIIDTMILWITVKWRPKKMFSFDRLKELFSYGWKLLVSGLIDVVYNDIRQLIIGKLYSSSDLAYYNQGKKYTQVIVSNINTSIDSVLLPTMSKAQDDIAEVKTMTRRAIKTSTYIMAPMMMGLAFTSKQIVSVLLTDKWLPCVPFMCIFCVVFMFYPIHTANLNAIKALGRSDWFLKLEIIKKAIGLIALLATMWVSPFAMALSMLVTSLINQVVNSWPNRKLLNYTIGEQWKDILPGIGLAVTMGIIVYVVGRFLTLPTIATLLIQIVLGATIYLAGSICFKMESFVYLSGAIRKLFNR